MAEMYGLSALKDTELCRIQEGQSSCRQLRQQEVKLFNWPKNACIQNDCTGCVKRWRSQLISKDYSFLEPTNFRVTLHPNVTGKHLIYECSRDGFPCICTPLDPCHGTTTYCLREDCNKNNTCYCTPSKAIQRVTSLTTDGEIENPKIISFLVCARNGTTGRHRRHQHTRRHLMQEDEAVYENNDIKVKYNEPVFTLNQPGTLIIRVNGLEKIITIKSEKGQAQLNQAIVPDEFLRFQDEMKFIFVSLKGQTVKGEVHVEGKIVCRRLNCLLCWDLLNHLQCLPDYIKFAIYASLVLLSTTMIIYVRYAFKIIWSTFRIIFLTIRQIWRILRGTSRLSLIAGARLGERIRRTAGDLRQAIDPEAPPPGGLLKTLTIAAILAVGCAECTNHLVMAAEQKDCEKKGDALECKIITNAQVTLPNLEYTQCLWFEDGAGTTLFSLRMKLLEATCSWQTVRSYYTFTVDHRQINTLYCANNDACGWGTHCKAEKSFPGITREAQGYPGITNCHAADSNSAGCFILDSQHCHFYRLYLIPDYMKTYEVRRIVSHGCEYRLQIEEGKNGTTETLDIHSQATTRNGIRIQLLGAFDQPTPIVNQFLIHRVGHPQEAYLDDASATGRPTAGWIGDVQANSSLSKDFIFDKNMFKCNFYENNMECERRTSYLDTIIGTKETALPTTIAYHHFLIDDEGNLKSTLLRTSPVVIALNFEDYKMVTETVTVCPKITEDTATAKGCYACAPLARITFSAHSTCRPGHVTVGFEVIKVSTRAVFLDTKVQKIVIEFHSDQRCLQDKLCLHARTVTACKVIKFCLDEATIELPRLNYSGQGYHSVSQSPTDQWWSLEFLSGATGWANMLKLGTSLITGLLVIIFAASTLISLCCRRL